MDSKQEYKDAIEVSVIFHEGQRMFAVPKQPAQIAGFDVVLDSSMPPNTMKFVQPAQQQEPVGWMCESYDKHGKLQSKCIAMNPQKADPNNPLMVVKPLVFANSSPQAAPVQQEPVAWKNAAIRLGEELSSVGPDGYYDMTAEQWLDWAMDQRPQGKNSLPAPRPWVGLTHDEYDAICDKHSTMSDFDFLADIEAKLKEKNQ